MKGFNLSNLCKPRVVAEAEGATTGTVYSDPVDTAGYQGVLFLTDYHVLNAGNYVFAEMHEDDAFGTHADLEGSKVTPDTVDGAVWVDVFRPLLRYVRLACLRGASTARGPIWAVLYGKHGDVPVDNNVADEAVGVLVVSPPEGTA